MAPMQSPAASSCLACLLCVGLEKRKVPWGLFLGRSVCLGLLTQFPPHSGLLDSNHKVKEGEEEYKICAEL